MGVRQHSADEGIGEQRRRRRAGEDAQIGKRFAAPAQQVGGQEQQHGGKLDRLVDAVDRYKTDLAVLLAGGMHAGRRRGGEFLDAQ